MLGVEDLARARRGDAASPITSRRATASAWACSPRPASSEVAEQVAAAGISVIALPHTNLFLQGRESPGRACRGRVTAVKALRAAGVNVAAGADNLQDPFNPVGRGDPLETAGLMVMAAHLLPADALDMVSVAARTAIGLGAQPGSCGGSSRNHPRGDRVRPGRSPGRPRGLRLRKQSVHTIATEPSGSLLYTPTPWGQTRVVLAGRRALITGAARGIGAEIAASFHREGAELALVTSTSSG